MATIPEAEVKLIQDKELEQDADPSYGKYLGTFFSAHRQERGTGVTDDAAYARAAAVGALVVRVAHGMRHAVAKS
jgi:hypothetical protein